MGERGGLGGGDCGLVSGSAGCTAAGTVGAGRGLEALEGVPAGVFRRKRKRRLARSRNRDMDVSSRARKSSWSLFRSASRRLLTLGGTKGEGVLGGTSVGSMWGKVMSDRPAGASEPAGGSGGGEAGAASNGSSSFSASRAKRLAAAKRMAVAASMLAGGGGRAAHMFVNVRNKTCWSSPANGSNSNLR